MEINTDNPLKNVQSPDWNKERLEQLKELMPDLFTNDGKLNINELKQIVDPESLNETERYEFRWFGKSKAKREAFTPTDATLVFDEERSVNPEHSENLIIEGENLQVLKLLSKSYREQIKCIYIDPPYNTGKDFVYSDNFANDLKKMLPRLPLVDDVRDFWAFSKAGRKLAELHLNYENVSAYEGVSLSSRASGNDTDYLVEKMRFPTGKKAKDCPDTILYNSKITISNIPAEAYEYVVNGKSAIEWIMERYAITTHKDSGITNDPNDWSAEVGNPRYILDLLLSIINLSVQTVEIVKGLPGVRFE